MTAPVSARGLAKRAAREAERRREAAALLRLMASACGYSAEQISNGMSPAQARQAVVEMAGEFAVAALSLRRLVRLPARERASRAAFLAAQGLGTTEIATRLGVSPHTAWNYQRGRRGDGQPWAAR
jgi:hypothetical protein